MSRFYLYTVTHVRTVCTVVNYVYKVVKLFIIISPMIGGECGCAPLVCVDLHGAVVLLVV